MAEVGQRVRLIQPVIEGVVLDTRYNKDVKSLEHLVDYGSDDAPSQRWFVDGELEVF